MILAVIIVVDLALLGMLWSAWQSLGTHNKPRYAVVVYALALLANIVALVW